MCKNIYIEEISGNFDGFDYNLNADIENDGAVEVSAFINHSHISFNDMINDFKTMLNCLKSYFELNDYNFASFEVADSKGKDYEINISPNESVITIQIFGANFKEESLVQSFAYSVGYIQSFLLHSESELKSEDTNN